ncbi:MAG: DnaJ domain-containing protein, partial [Nodosilinea sp.]
MRELDNAYRILELEPGASLEAINQAYKDLVFVWHPDRIPQDNERLYQKAQDKIKALNHARDLLRSHSRTAPAASRTSQSYGASASSYRPAYTSNSYQGSTYQGSTYQGSTYQSSTYQGNGNTSTNRQTQDPTDDSRSTHHNRYYRYQRSTYGGSYYGNGTSDNGSGNGSSNTGHSNGHGNGSGTHASGGANQSQTY